MPWVKGADGKVRDSSGNIQCPHGRIRRNCKECVGSSICEHGRLRPQCKECGGSGICEHDRIRTTCGRCQPHTNVARYRYGARRRGYVWQLTQAQGVYLMQQPCQYCGTSPAGGIDRVKNEYGYTAQNSVPCCTKCNFGKLKLTATEFIEICHAVSKHCVDKTTFKARWLKIRKGLNEL